MVMKAKNSLFFLNWLKGETAECEPVKTTEVKGRLLSDFVININGQSSVKYLLSQLRDKNTNTF
jgi:hypothetical protein